MSPANAGGMRNKTARCRSTARPSRSRTAARPSTCTPTPTRSSTSSKAPGTIWLGDKEVTVKPGDLVVIPKGTPHAGTKPDGRTIKAIAIKTPPQAPDDIKLLN